MKDHVNFSFWEHIESEISISVVGIGLQFGAYDTEMVLIDQVFGVQIFAKRFCVCFPM